MSADAQHDAMLLHMQGTAYEDLEAAKWYEGCHKSTTNEARNSNVQEFWQSCKGNAAGAIQDLTGSQRDATQQLTLVRPAHQDAPHGHIESMKVRSAAAAAIGCL
jgi:hypothetical protein